MLVVWGEKRLSPAMPFQSVGQNGRGRLDFPWLPVVGKGFDLRPGLAGCTLAV